jgi:uncharacterized protein (DUF433 family)
MAFPASSYVAERDGALYVAGSDVPLESVVIPFRDGESPKEIARSFPSLSLTQLYGSLAYYLENRQLIDAYIAECRRESELSVPR